MNINRSLDLVFEYYQKGDIKKAENICRNILNKKPNNVEALHFLGVIVSQRGQNDLAITYITKALQIDPKFADAYNNLGNIFQELKHLDKAISCYQKAIQLNPKVAKTYYNLGIALQDTNRLDEAIESYQRALHLNFVNYGIYNNLGLAFQEKGKLDEAIQYYQTSLKLKPDFADAYNNLGIAFKEKEKTDEAIICFKKALQINPTYAEVYYNIGNILREEGKQDEAIAAYEKSLECKPDFLKASWARCMAQLPIVYKDTQEIQVYRKRYNEELIKLRDTISLRSPRDIDNATDAVGSLQPFYLGYQGFNDRELQQVYGDIVCNIMSKRYPQFTEQLNTARYSPLEPIRIGVVSGYFLNHSVWKLFKGWFQNMNKQQFIIYGYNTGKKQDKETEVARQCFTRFDESIQSIEGLCENIRRDNLHVIIFPEIGMHPMTLKIASLRLAPVQCVSWGHPDTSGLRTIDYFLSSNLMEPPNAKDHYTEKLIRLPNISIYYTPLDLPFANIKRETFGLRQKSILYLCSQSLFKYLPQYDEIFPQTSKEVGDCQFLFISNRSTFITEQFRCRINNAFSRFDMNADNHVVFLPRLNAEQYHAVNCLSDIYLDSIGWSGGNTTLEAIACNLPVVTIPGTLMRGRHSSAILTMMGMTETIAATLDEYVELAVRLGQDSEWRHQISEKIAVNKHRIYHDRTCINALEDFLEKAVKETLK